jgi:hypothetical protein
VVNLIAGLIHGFACVSSDNFRGGIPPGLSAAVYTASEGLATLLLEREAIGGQAGGSSLLRNYLIGADPHTDWLPAGIQRDSRGFLLTGSDLRRDNPPDGWPL